MFFLYLLLTACTQVLTYRQPAIIPTANPGLSYVAPLGVVTMRGLRAENPMTMMLEYY